MMRAGQGFFVIKDAIPADILKELNEIFDAVQGPVGDDGHMPPFPAGNALHWGPSYRWLLDNPVVSPIMQELVGADPDAKIPSFRIDHVNVQCAPPSPISTPASPTHRLRGNWCNPEYIAKNGSPGTTLHGGWKGTGGSQFFRYHDGAFYSKRLPQRWFRLSPRGQRSCLRRWPQCGHLRAPRHHRQRWRFLLRAGIVRAALLPIRCTPRAHPRVRAVTGTVK